MPWNNWIGNISANAAGVVLTMEYVLVLAAAVVFDDIFWILRLYLLLNLFLFLNPNMNMLMINWSGYNVVVILSMIRPVDFQVINIIKFKVSFIYSVLIPPILLPITSTIFDLHLPYYH